MKKSTFIFVLVFGASVFFKAAAQDSKAAATDAAPKSEVAPKSDAAPKTEAAPKQDAKKDTKSSVKPAAKKTASPAPAPKGMAINDPGVPNEKTGGTSTTGTKPSSKTQVTEAVKPSESAPAKTDSPK